MLGVVWDGIKGLRNGIEDKSEQDIVGITSQSVQNIDAWKMSEWDKG